MTVPFAARATAVAVMALGCLLPALAQTPAAADSALDRVMKSGVLRACAPGDYKPFGFMKPDGSFEGMDIDLGQSLATAMGAKLEPVKTTWANLMADFTGGKCDIALGGISVTLERQKRVFFSAPYMVNGKTPIVRCEDVQRYQSVADIDKPEVRAIANPGGSNERFAKANYKQAKLTIHTDNLSIFDEVAQRRADVFVTEAAEALVQQKLHPGVLCAVNPDKPLQYAENAIVLPRGDVAMKAFVDQWLHLAQASGEYKRIEDKWTR